MFISTKEKQALFEKIRVINLNISFLMSENTWLKARVKVLEGGKTPSKKPRKQSTMSAEGRARIGAAVKAYHAKKKLEKENATSISTTSI